MVSAEKERVLRLGVWGGIDNGSTHGNAHLAVKHAVLRLT